MRHGTRRARPGFSLEPRGRCARLRPVVPSPAPSASAGRVLSPEALAAVVLWGVSFVATRIALEALHPVGLIAARLALGAGMLVVVQLARRVSLVPEPGDRARCALLGAILGGHLLLQAYGLRYTTAIQTGWIISFIPVMLALGGRAFLGKRLSAAGWVGVAVGAAGVLVVASASLPDFEDARFGDLLQLVSCVTWTVYTLAASRPAERSGPLRATTSAMVVAALLAAAAVPAFGWRPEAGEPVGPSTVAAVVFLGLGCNGIAYWLWMRGLRRDGPARIGATLYLEPLVTLVAARLVLDEPVTGHALVGGPIVLLGVWLVGRGARS